MNFLKKILIIIIACQIFLVDSAEKTRGRGQRERGAGREQGTEKGRGRWRKEEKTANASELSNTSDNKNELLAYIASTNIKSLPAIKQQERKRGGGRGGGGGRGQWMMDPYRGLTQLEEIVESKEPAAVRQRSFTIITDAEKQLKDIDWTKRSVIDKTTVNDLNILIGSNTEPGTNLASVIGEGAYTDLGKTYITTIIARPTDDVQLLQKRQTIIKNINSLDEESLTSIKTSLQQFALHENYLVGLWGENLPQLYPERDYYNSVGSNYLNESSTALQAKSYFSNLTALTGESMRALTAGLLITYGASLFFNVDIPFKDRISSYTDRIIGSILGRGSGLPIPRSLTSAVTYITQPQIRGAIMIIAGYNAAKMLKTSVQARHSDLLQNQVLLKRVMHIAQLIIAMQKVNNALKEKPEIIENLTLYPGLKNFFTNLPQEREKIAKLFELLKTRTFEPSQEPNELKKYMFNYGRVLVATKLLTEIEEHLASPLAAIGEIDAYMTFANIIRTNQNNRVSYCYPTYIYEGAEKPELAIEEAWNPFVDTKNVIPNTVILNNKTSENMVLTGPNSGGKSTILKSIAIALILAQSIGIAPAKIMNFTPFANISTYMNVMDVTVGVDQASLFQSEVDRVFEYGDTVNKLLKEGKFSFAIFDEIFSGTNLTMAVKLGLEIAMTLVNYGNNMGIISTHFSDLAKKLEEVTNGKYKNYKVSVEILPGDKIKRLYKLEPGISDQDIAELVFRERGKNSPFFKDVVGKGDTSAADREEE